jgi:hypothetical protein
MKGHFLVCERYMHNYNVLNSVISIIFGYRRSLGWVLPALWIHRNAERLFTGDDL